MASGRMGGIPVGLAVAVALFVVACGDDGDESGKTWRIGVEAPLSGDLAVLGDGMLKGAQLAASEINAGGGLLGRNVEIVPIDDGGDAERGVNAANEAIAAGLDGVVGPYHSKVGLATLPLYIRQGLVPIRLTSDEATSGLGFTLQPMTYQIAPVAAEAMTRWLQAGTVAIVFDETEAYTRTVSRSVREELEKAGVEIVAFDPIRPGEPDYADAVARLAASGADVIYAAVYYPEGAEIAKEMIRQEVEPQCLADYGSYDTGFVQEAGIEAAQSCPVVGVPAPGDFEAAQPFVEAFREKFGGDPGTWSPYTYDSVRLLAEAVETAEGFDPDALTEVLANVDGWTGWTGQVTIDPQTGNREPATVVITTTDDEGTLHVDREWAAAVGAPY